MDGAGACQRQEDTAVLSPERFQVHLRQRTRQGREGVAVAPFTLFVHLKSDAPESSYAIPDAPVAGGLTGALVTVRAAFAARGRRACVEFVEEYAPHTLPRIGVHIALLPVAGVVSSTVL